MTEPQEPCLLAFDTATRGCSAALWRAGAVVAARAAAMERGQSEALVPMVQDVMREAGVGFAALDALAVTIGPGAFTGLRIGLATARGIALVAACPVIGVTTLDAVAHGVPETERRGKRVLVVLDAKRADHYAQVFSPDLVAHGAPQALPPASIAGLVAGNSVVVAGDGAALVETSLRAAGVDFVQSAGTGVPEAAVVAKLAAARWGRGERPAGLPSPLYLRAPDVSRPRPAARPS